MGTRTRAVTYEEIFSGKKPFLEDLFDTLRRHPFTAEELVQAHAILEGRLRHKTCTECGKFVPEAKGKQYLSRDLSKTRFVCDDCFKKLP